MTSDYRTYAFDASVSPPIFLPTEVYERLAELIDITQITDPYRVYLSRDGKTVYSGADYARAVDEAR